MAQMLPSLDNDQQGVPYKGAALPATGGYARGSQLKLGHSNNLTDPLRNFRFVVNINHKPSNTAGGMLSQGLGFMSVSGIAATTEAIPYREGGMNTTVHQLPGQTSFSPITLQRGVTLGGNSAGPWNWFRQLFDVVGGQGTGPGNRAQGNQFRCNVDINVLEHPITHMAIQDGGPVIPVKLRVMVRNAWITGISFSDLNAGDNAVMVEQMTLVHEGFQVAYGPAGRHGSAARFS